MQIWAVANQKGGVGKTTTAVSLAGIASEMGKRVLLVDMDPHGSLTSYFRLNPDDLSSSTYTLFQEHKNLSEALVGQLVMDTNFADLGLLPASTGLAILERQNISSEGMGLVMTRALALMWNDFDLVILDCPPQLGILMVNALAACQRLIIPVQTEFLAMKGLERILHTLQMVQRSRSRELPYVIVPTMFDRRTQASVSTLRTLRNQYGEPVWPGSIPVDTKFRDASRLGIPPNYFSRDCRGVEAYRSLFHYLQTGETKSQVLYGA